MVRLFISTKGGQPMINWSEFIGIKYTFNGRTKEEGMDCLGLLIAVYKSQGWTPDFSDGLPIEKNWFKSDPLRFARYMLKHFDRVDSIDELEEGDVIIAEINSESHTLIYAGFGKFLSTFPQVGLFAGGVSQMNRLKYFPDIKIQGLFKRRK